MSARTDFAALLESDRETVSNHHRSHDQVVCLATGLVGKFRQEVLSPRVPPVTVPKMADARIINCIYHKPGPLGSSYTGLYVRIIFEIASAQSLNALMITTSGVPPVPSAIS